MTRAFGGAPGYTVRPWPTDQRSRRGARGSTRSNARSRRGSKRSCAASSSPSPSGLAARVQRAVEGELARSTRTGAAPAQPAGRVRRQSHPQRDRPAARPGAPADGRARRGEGRAGAAGPARRSGATPAKRAARDEARPPRRSGGPAKRAAAADGRHHHPGRARRPRPSRRRAQRAARPQRPQAPRRRRPPGADADAARDRVVGREGRAVALRQRPPHDPHAPAVRAQPRVAQLRVRPRARQQRRRGDGRPRLRRVPHRLGRPRRAGERQHARDLHRRLHPDDRARGAGDLRRPGRQPVRLLLRRGPVAPVARRQRRPAGAQPRRDGDARRLPPHGPDDVDDPGGPRRAGRHARRHRQRAGRRDAQLVPRARARPATSSTTSTSGSTSGTTTSSPPTRS